MTGAVMRPPGIGGSAVFALALVGLVGLAGCTAPVAAALDEADANRVAVALDQAGIDATKEADPQAEGKYRVAVPRDDAARALAILREEELPRPRARSLDGAAGTAALVPSQAAEHAQLVLGLAGELERTLGGVDGVLSARVHLNLPPREPFRDVPSGKASASVLVEHRGATPPLAPESIQRLVAGGAPGLVPADVAVVFVPRPATGRAREIRAELAHVGPITVARASTTTLKLALAGLVSVVLALAAATLVLYARLARERRARESAPTVPPLGPAFGRGPAASVRPPPAAPPP
jgi:type III secretion protein J